MLKLVRIDKHSRHHHSKPSVIGLDPLNDKVIQAPLPTFKWAMGLSKDEARAYCRIRGWGFEEVPMASERRN